MKVLGIYGSPRKEGNSDLLLDRALQGARSEGAQVVTLRASDLELSGCQECHGCDETGECVMRDGMDQVYPLLREADSIILATPIFFYSAPAQLKALIDRAQAPWNRRRLSKPKQRWSCYESGRGYLIAVGATKGAKLFEGIELTAKYFFDALDMSYDGSVLCKNVEEKGAVAANSQAMQEAYQLGRQAGRSTASAKPPA